MPKNNNHTVECNTGFKIEFMFIEEGKFIMIFVLSTMAVHKSIYRVWFNFEREDYIHTYI